MREYNVSDLAPFFASGSFADAGFTLDAARRSILLAR